MNAGSDYFMNDARETTRLTEKTNAASWVDRYLAPRLNGSARLLDVGCGPGVLASAVARAYRELNVIGLDLCAERFQATKSTRPANLEILAGNAHALPFLDGSFDFVVCRFLLEYLATREQAIREMIRVCKSGGHVMLQDLDGQLLWHYPEDSEFQNQLNQVLAGLACTGFDPFVGRKLFSLAKFAGLEDIKVTAESYHLFAGPIDKQNLRLWEMKLDIAMPAVTRVLDSADAARALKVRFLDYLSREDTLTYSVLFTVLGTTPLQRAGKRQ